jgi:hypothetical protein
LEHPKVFANYVNQVSECRDRVASDKYLISKVSVKSESIHPMRAIEECIEARNAAKDKSVTE